MWPGALAKRLGGLPGAGFSEFLVRLLQIAAGGYMANLAKLQLNLEIEDEDGDVVLTRVPVHSGEGGEAS